MTYQVTVDIHGYETYEVDADNKTEALIKFNKQGASDFKMIEQYTHAVGLPIVRECVIERR